MTEEPPVASSARSASADPGSRFPRVSVVIPARDEGNYIADTVAAVRAQRLEGTEIEVVVVDDGSSDETGALARTAGARVVAGRGSGGQRGGNPGAARNLGAAESSGDPIVFLDADCTPGPDWLARLLAVHAAGAVAAGGSIAMPEGLSGVGRADYYGCWYHAHPRMRGQSVPNHSPANLSVRRSAFFATRGFTEEAPVCDGHEELAWQADLLRLGHEIRFEPLAAVTHRHGSDLSGMMRRNYRWGYTMLQSKATDGAVRFPGLYRYPWVIVASGLPVAILHLVYIVLCWLRAREYRVLLSVPLLLVGRMAYAAGMTVGGIRWLRARGHANPRAQRAVPG